MAEQGDDAERTEEPSQKRLEEALNRGDVVKSQEVNTWFVLAGATLVLMAFSAGMGHDLTAMMRGLIANSWQISVDGPALPHLFKKIGAEILGAVAIPFLLLLLPDHATPLDRRTHTSDPVPYLLVGSGIEPAGGEYTEAGVADRPVVPGHQLLPRLLA